MKWTQHITAQASDEASKIGSQQLFADSISFHLQNDTIENVKNSQTHCSGRVQANATGLYFGTDTDNTHTQTKLKTQQQFNLQKK